MKSPELYGRNNGRLLTRRLSPELQSIFESDPQILNRQNHDLCGATPLNFIGSFIALILRDKIKDLHDKNNMPMPDSLKSPIVFSRKTSILTLDQPCTYNWNNRHGTAHSVYVKKACGKKAGLVTRGPYAGLLLRTYNAFGSLAKMRAIRLFNDEHYAYECLPYDLNFSLGILNRIIEGSKHTLSPIQYAIFDLTTTEYYKLALEASGVNTTNMSDEEIVEQAKIIPPNSVWISDMLAIASQKAGKPIDVNLLHMTKPL